jgi:hypothetical protein
MDCQASEVVLQARRWCGTATPNGPLSIAKGVLAIASPSLLSRRELVARRAVGLTLWLWPWISRRGGRDATRQTEATNPCATGAAQGAWRSRSSASLAPRWSGRCTRSSASTCGHGSCTSPGCYPRGARPAGVGCGLGRGRRRVVRRADSDRMGGLAAYLGSRRA